MPLFTYIFKDCENRFEMLVGKPDSPVSCPECGSGNVKKAVSRFAPKTASAADSCAHAESCPSAGHSACGCGGCCQHHH